MLLLSLKKLPMYNWSFNVQLGQKVNSCQDKQLRMKNILSMKNLHQNDRQEEKYSYGWAEFCYI